MRVLPHGSSWAIYDVKPAFISEEERKKKVSWYCKVCTKVQRRLESIVEQWVDKGLGWKAVVGKVGIQFLFFVFVLYSFFYSSIKFLQIEGNVVWVVERGESVKG